MYRNEPTRINNPFKRFCCTKESTLKSIDEIERNLSLFSSNIFKKACFNCLSWYAIILSSVLSAVKHRHKHKEKH